MKIVVDINRHFYFFVTLSLIVLLLFPTRRSMALEVVLAKGNVLNLGLSNNTSVSLDQVTMENKSVILIPRSLAKFELSINKLKVNGVAYIYVYDDQAVAPPSKPGKLGRAAVCETGAAGTQTPPPAKPKRQELILNIGFGAIEKLIIVAEGASGLPGAEGGDGQDGGDSAGMDRCVLHSCDGGNGGSSGMGGKGGQGGDGAAITLRYSGIAPEKIHQNVLGNQSSGGLGRDLVGITLQPKPLFDTPPDNKGIEILKSSVGQATVISERDEGPLPTTAPEFPGPAVPAMMGTPTIDDASELGVTVWNAGGPGGAGGRDGLPGHGGSGYKCTLGSNQKVGADGVQTFGVGEIGMAGKPGVLYLEKTD